MCLLNKSFPVRTCTVGDFAVHERFWFCLVQVSTNFLCLQLALPFSWLPVVQVTMHCTLHCLVRRLEDRMLVLVMVLVTTSMKWAPAPEVLWTNNSVPFSLNLYTSKRRSLKFLLSRHGCPVRINISRKHLDISRVDLQRWNRISVPSLQVCANSRHMLPQHQFFPVPQDPDLHSNMLTAPQPQGPMAQGHLMTTETRDEDLILPQAQKMNNHEVPSYSDSLVNNISKELHSGSIPFGMNLVCRLVTNLLEFIAKQTPCQSDLFLKHEANVKTLLSDVRILALLIQSTVPSVVPILLSQCVNPDQLKSERSENSLSRCGKSWLTNLKFFFLMQMTKVYSSSPHSILDAKISSASKIAETALENQFSNLLHLVADKRLLLLHLICLFLVFRLRYYNGFSLKPTGLRCDGRSLASPLLRRLAGRGAFFCSFLIRWVLHLAFSLIRGGAMHESASCSREDALGDCGHHAIPFLAFFLHLGGFVAAIR